MIPPATHREDPILRAKRRRCPECKRKSALRFRLDLDAVECRWRAEGKCRYRIAVRDAAPELLRALGAKGA